MRSDLPRIVAKPRPLLYCKDLSHCKTCVNHNMHRPNILFLSIFALLPLTSFSLTIPFLDLISQRNHTTTSPLTINNHHHLNLTDLPSPDCYFITDPPMSTLSNLKCSFLAEDFCTELASTGPKARNSWVWAEISGCALGYYFPPEAILPNLYTCERRIFGAIRGTCATDPRYNAGSMNVGRLPDFGDDGTELVPHAGRYLMAPERLTL